MRFLSILVCSLLSFTLFSQTELSRVLECGHDQLAYSQSQQITLDSLEAAYQSRFSKDFADPPAEGIPPPADRNGGNDSATLKSSSSPPPFVLPIVFHIIHENGTELLGQARIEQSLEFLNQSFANTDYYDQGTGVNTQIQFCLAQRTPDNLATTGVTYHEDPLTNLNSNDDLTMKNLARWEPRDYVNVYVVREICGLGLGCGVAGYAYYPSAHGSGVDGIVVEARWLGLNEANNSVLTHELGHYLGLRHTFDGGCTNNDCLLDGDRVCDTPPDQSTAAVPCGATANSCSTDTDSGFPTDENDMFNNYMDYGSFSCYNALTAGQADRMHFFIDGIRRSLLESMGCLTPCFAPITADFSPSDAGPLLAAGTTVNFTNTTTNGTTYEWYVNGVLVATTQNFSYTFANEGNYNIRLVAAGNPPLCSASEFHLSYTVQCQLSSGFTTSNDQPVLDDVVSFTATDAGVDTYSWTVNGSNVSNVQNYTHTFSAPGFYQLCLSVRLDSCSRETCRNFYISQPPTTGDCFGPTYLSLYGLGIDFGNVAGTAIHPDGTGGLWQTATIGPEVLLQRLDASGNVLSSKSFWIGGLPNSSVRSIVTLSDGSLLLAGFGDLNALGHGSFLLRYDPVADVIVYLEQLQTTGTLFALVPIPNDADRFLALFGVEAASSPNASNEYWIFDVEGMTGNIGNVWDNLSAQGGPHSIYSGIFRQGAFVGTGRIGVTAASSSFRSCLLRYPQANVIGELQLLHRPSSSTARLYGSQLLEVQQNLYGTHWGNQSGTDLTTNSFVYFNRWNPNNNLDWTREIRTSNATVVIPRGMVYDNGVFYLIGNLEETNLSSRIFVLALDEAGQVLWSNTYATQDGILQPGISAAGENLIVTNDRLIISCSLEPSTVTGGPGAAALLQINLDGTINDACVTVTPLGMTSSLVDATSEDFQLNTVAGSPVSSALEYELQEPTFPRYTACQDTCPTNSGDCNITGDGFAQYWNYQEGFSAEAQQMIPDGTGGLFVVGASEEFLMINRLNFNGEPISSFSVAVPSGSGPTTVIGLETAAEGKLLLCGIVPPRPGMSRTAFLAAYDPVANAIIWWHELDDDAELKDLHVLPGSNNFLVTGSHLAQGSSNNSTLLFQERSLSTGQLTGNLYREFEFGPSNDQVLNSVLYNGQLFLGSRLSYASSNASMRAAISQFDPSTGNEVLSMIASPSANGNSRTYTSSFLLTQQGVYILYRGDLNGTGTTDVSRVYLAHFTTNGQWIWGQDYDIQDYDGEYGLNLAERGDQLIISGNGYEPHNDIFCMSVNKAGGAVNWAKAYDDSNSNVLSFNLRGDQGMLVTSNALFFAGKVNDLQVPPNAPSHPFLIQADLEGNIDTSGCLRARDLQITATNLAPWNETGLEPWQATLEDLTFDPDVLQITPLFLTACLDSCDVFVEEICDNGIDDDGNGATDCEDPALADSCCCRTVPIVMLPADTAICAGSSLIITPELNGTSLSLNWSNGSTDTVIVVNQAGTYVLEVIDDCGNQASDTIVVSVIPPADPPDLGPDTAVCDNGVFELDAGPGYQTYRWSDLTTNQTATFYEPGTYGVTVTDGCGNAFTDEITISQLPITQLDLPETITICPEDSLVFAVNGFDSYQWFPESAFPCNDCASVTIYPPASGDTLLLTLVATSQGNGCISVDSILVIGGAEQGTYVEAMLCEGEQYAFNDTLLTTSGLYQQSAFCGGTDTLLLNVNQPPPVTSFSEELCRGDSVLIFGQYRLLAGVYTDTLMAFNGCDSILEVQLSVFEQPVSMEAFTICAGDSMEIFGIFRSAAGSFFDTISLVNSPCDSLAMAVLNVTPLPTAVVTMYAECGQTVAGITVLPTNPGTTINWQDAGISGFSPDLAAGDYAFSLVGVGGCRFDTSISVFIPPAVAFEFLVYDPLCPETAAGSILLSPPATGTLVSLDGQFVGAVDSIGGLSAGVYEVSFTDTSGCSGSTRLTIEDPDGFQITLPRDTVLRLGNSLTIRGQLYGLPLELANVVWSPTDYLNCDSCLIVLSQPTRSITYFMTVTDTLGCSRTEDIHISLDRRERIYLPNAFSPNGDGINDVFFPNTGLEVESVELLQIHDRWGEMVFEQLDFPPNDPAYGWDGKLRGKRLNPQVLVYHLRLRLIDGSMISLAGDLTLLR